MGKTRILILGGTTEARRLAEALSKRPQLDVVLSLAGRTAAPLAQPVPGRIGGFGGVEGLASYLADEAIDLLVDATHPFATQISRNAVAAARLAAVPGFALCRAAWEPVEGDRWQSVSDVPAAVAALGAHRRNVLLAIGRQEAHHVNVAPQHAYWVRSVDPVEPPLTVTEVSYIRDIGPFHLDDEIELMRRHRIDVVVTKNSGGDATYAKIEAARKLGLEVIMIKRQAFSDIPTFTTVEAALCHIDHFVTSPRKRGV
jgi:precorrin-6A/cobalt-precorrin-6A reductase